MKFAAVLSLIAFAGICHANQVQNDTTYWAEQDAMELAMNAGFFQGDMALNEEQDMAVLGLVDPSGERNVRKDASYLWPDSTVPYKFTPGHFTSSDEGKVNQWLQELSTLSCVKFVPWSGQRDYVRIFNGDGCFSRVGRQYNEQELSLTGTSYTKGHCMFKKTVAHEFLHAAGFWHEQSRMDRDNYLTIHWNNISPDMTHNFNKVKSSEAKTIGSYDYLSVMQYGAKAFSNNGQNTMTRKDGSTNLGQPWDGFLTSQDVGKLKSLYKCGQTTPRPPSCRDSAGNEEACKSNARYGACTNPSHRAMMEKYCKKSCNIGC